MATVALLHMPQQQEEEKEAANGSNDNARFLAAAQTGYRWKRAKPDAAAAGRQCGEKIKPTAVRKRQESEREREREREREGKKK
jgi:hypothetical protein